MLDRYLFDYLEEEIFHPLAPALRHFLLQSSILAELTVPLCNAVVEGGQSEAHLAQLVRAGFPLSRTEGADGSFRLPPLWRDFLRDRLQQSMAHAIPQLHGRALAWYEAHGKIEAALPHALASQTPAEAARLLSRHASILLRRGQVTALHDWLAALPEATILATPRLAIARAWTLLDRGQLQRAAPYLDTLHTYLTHHPTADEASEILALRALAAAMSHQPATALTLAHSAEAAVTGADPALQPYVAFSLGMAYRMAFEPAPAEQALREAAAQATAHDNPYIATSAWANLGLMVLDYGRLTEAEQINQRLLRLLQTESGQEHADAAVHHLDLARIYYEWNDLERAATALQRSLDLCAQWDNRPLTVRALLTQSQILEARRQLAEAQAAVEQADGLARQTGDRVLVHSVVRRWVLLALAQGDLPRARQWACQLPAAAEPYGFFTALMEARLLLAAGEPGHALEHLADAWEELATAPLPHAQIQTLALQALAHAAYRQSHQAATALQTALALGIRERYTRIFLDLGQPLERLLRTIPIPAELATYVAHLSAAFAAERAEATAPLLTPREQEILRLLALGCSNQEMAERLVISPATLKRHVSNLYLKLAVHSRTQALARAAELHLL
jgi:LuxR family maltose regulon positive regulatory protein